MRQTDFNLEFLSSIVPSEAIAALTDIINDMELEVTEVSFSQSL